MPQKPSLPESPMGWQGKLNEDNQPDYLKFSDDSNPNLPIPSPNDPWQGSEAIGSRVLPGNRSNSSVVSSEHPNGRKPGMRNRLTTETLNERDQMRVAGKAIDLAGRLAGKGATDDEIVRIARVLYSKNTQEEIDLLHASVARIAAEAGRVAFDMDESAIDDEGPQKQPDPTQTESYVKIVRGPTDSAVQMSLKNQSDVRQPTASRKAEFAPSPFPHNEPDGDEGQDIFDFGDSDDYEDNDYSDDEESEFDDMNDDDGLDDDVEEDGDDDWAGEDDDMEAMHEDPTSNGMMGEGSGMPISEADLGDNLQNIDEGEDEFDGFGDDEDSPDIVDEEDVEDGDLHSFNHSHHGDDSGDVDQMGDMSDVDDMDGFDSEEPSGAEDFMFDDSDLHASLEDIESLARMGFSSGAESAGVLSHRSLHMEATDPNLFVGQRAARREVDPRQRGDFRVWDTENDPELLEARGRRPSKRAARRAPAPAPKAKQRKARREAPAQQSFRPSRVRTSAKRQASSNPFDEMFGVPDVGGFFQY